MTRTRWSEPFKLKCSTVVVTHKRGLSFPPVPCCHFYPFRLCTKLDILGPSTHKIRPSSDRRIRGPLSRTLPGPDDAVSVALGN